MSLWCGEHYKLLKIFHDKVQLKDSMTLTAENFKSYF